MFTAIVFLFSVVVFASFTGLVAGGAAAPADVAVADSHADNETVSASDHGNNETVSASDHTDNETADTMDPTVNASAIEAMLSVNASVSLDRGRADIAFLIDTSGSMDDEIQAIQSGLVNFTSNLQSQGIDVRYAVVTFADQVPYNVRQGYTSNLTEIQRTLNAISTGGGTERSFDTINDSIGKLSERPDADEFFIAFTDEDSDTEGTGDNLGTTPNASQVADRLDRAGVSLFAVTLPEGTTNSDGFTIQPDLSIGRVANLSATGEFFNLAKGDFSVKFERGIAARIANRTTGLDVTVTQVRRSGFPTIDVYAEVSDGNGNPVTGLTASDFTITEDGTLQTIDSVDTLGSTPGTDVSVALAIDRSGSMNQGNVPSKLDRAEEAAIDFVRQFGTNDEGLIVSFSDDARIDQRWTRSNTELVDAIDFNSDGYTELYGATTLAVKEAAPRAGRSAVVVLTDGKPSSDSGSLSTAIDTAQARNVPVYTIGLGSNVNERNLRELASETGGDYYQAPTASDLGAIYQEISQQISNEYRITYSTTNTATDGTTRLVRATADNGTQQASDTGQYTAPCAPLPTADFTSATSGRTVSFDGSPSAPNGGSIVAYRWDFTNDGRIDARGRTVSHTYSSSGTYEARLVVEKGCGVTDATTTDVTAGSGGGGGYTYRVPHALNTQQLASAWSSTLVVNATYGSATVSIDADGDGAPENTTTLSAGQTIGVSQPSEGAIVTSSDPVTVRYRYGSADFGAYEDGRYQYGVPEASMLGTEYYLPIPADSLDIAATTATTVRVDTDGDGQFDATRSLAANGTTTVQNISQGAHVVADDPVHVVVTNARWRNMDLTYAASVLPVSAAKETYYLPGHPGYNTQDPTEKTGVLLAGTQSGTTVNVGGRTVSLSEGETTSLRTGAGSATVDASAPVVALYAVHVRSQDWWSSSYRENIGLTTPVRPVEINAGSYGGKHFDGGLSAWTRYDPASVPSPQPPTGGSGVTINVTDATTSQGGTATVELRVEGADVAGYSADLRFDPSTVQIVDVQGVDFPDPVANIDNSAGRIVLSQSQTTTVSDPVLAELTVEGVGAPGQSAALRFEPSGTTLNDVTSQIRIDDYDPGSITIRSCTPGDANQDNQVTPLDATQVNRYVAGLPVTTTFDPGCADYDDSGAVTPLDATLILRDVAGLPTTSTTSVSTASLSAARTADLRIGSAVAAPGETVTVPLSISGADVAGYSARISFDPSVVQVESVTGVDLTDPVTNIDNSSGTVTLSASQSTAVTDPTVATLELRVVGSGGDTTPLAIDPSGSTANNVTASHSVTVTNGSVSVRAANGTPTTVGVVPSNSSIGVGGTQTFEVVVANGTESQGYDLTVSLGNGSVGRITDASVAGSPGLGSDTLINSANDSVSIRGAYLTPLSGSAPLTIATVTVEASAVGTTDVSLGSGSAVRDGNNDPYAITAFDDATLTVQNAVTLPGAAGPAGDADGDGLLEDVDGSGTADVFDAIALYNNRNAAVVQNNPQFFDFDGNGRVDVFDAVELYNEV